MADPYLETLAALSKASQADSEQRKMGISQEAQDQYARGLGRESRGNDFTSMIPAETPQELGIRQAAVNRGIPNGSSLDELRNYALMHAAMRGAGQSAAPMVNLEARKQEAAQTVRGNQLDPRLVAGRNAGPPFDVMSVPNPYGPSSGPQAGYPGPSGVPVAPAPPPMDPAKQRQLDEIDAAAAKAEADIRGIPHNAPGTKSAVGSQIDQRVAGMLAKLAEPPATMPALVQPGMQPPVVVPPPSPPVARFPLIPTPVYAPPVVYPTAPAPNMAGLDEAALRDYLVTHGGM